MTERRQSEEKQPDCLRNESGISAATMRRWKQFARAINTLTDLYGWEVKHAILDRKVRLSHSQVMDIAHLAEQFPEMMQGLADDINAGRTQNIKFFLRNFRAKYGPPRLVGATTIEAGGTK